MKTCEIKPSTELIPVIWGAHSPASLLVCAILLYWQITVIVKLPTNSRVTFVVRPLVPLSTLTLSRIVFNCSGSFTTDQAPGYSYNQESPWIAWHFCLHGREVPWVFKFFTWCRPVNWWCWLLWAVQSWEECVLCLIFISRHLCGCFLEDLFHLSP